MYGFIKKKLITVIAFIGLNANVNPLKCVSMTNQECKVRPAIMIVNSNEFLFYPYSIAVNKCSGSCNDINHHVLNYVFLMLLKTAILKYLI